MAYLLRESPNVNTLARLSDGKQGIIETVVFMRSLVDQYKKDPEIHALATSLVQFLDQKDYRAEIEKLFYFVRDQIRYVQDIYDVETVGTPIHTLFSEQGDCDDKATLLACLLESIGFVTAFVIAGYHGNDFEHVYLYVQNPISGLEMYLDPTEPAPAGWEAPNPTVKMFIGS